MLGAPQRVHAHLDGSDRQRGLPERFELPNMAPPSRRNSPSKGSRSRCRPGGSFRRSSLLAAETSPVGPSGATSIALPTRRGRRALRTMNATSAPSRRPRPAPIADVGRNRAQRGVDIVYAKREVMRPAHFRNLAMKPPPARVSSSSARSCRQRPSLAPHPPAPSPPGRASRKNAARHSIHRCPRIENCANTHDYPDGPALRAFEVSSAARRTIAVHAIDDELFHHCPYFCFEVSSGCRLFAAGAAVWSRGQQQSAARNRSISHLRRVPPVVATVRSTFLRRHPSN